MSITPLLLTLQLIAVSVVIAAAMGIVGAWAATVLQTAGRFGRFVAGMFLLAMVISVATPLVLHAAAWEATAGKFGWWTMTQTGARTDQSGVYGIFSGLAACGWIHGAFGTAIVVLATWYGTSRTPESIILQSRLDLGPISGWWKVRLPIAAPWFVASLIGTATIAATEMTVVDLYGYQTITDTFYLYNTVDPSIGQVLWTCAMPLTLASGLLTWLFVSRQRMLSVQTDMQRSVTTENLSKRLVIIAIILAAIVTAAVAVVPFAGLVIKAGHEVTIQRGSIQAIWSPTACWERIAVAPRLFAAEYRWTFMIGVLTGLASLLIAWPLAMLGRSHLMAERAFDLATVFVFVIPGPIVGMSVVQLFQLPAPGFRFLYGQTIVPTAIALLVRAVPVSYWLLRSGYRGIGDQVLDMARMDLSRLSRWWQVDRPLLARQASFTFVATSLFASGDVAAMLPVIPPGVTTVGTRLFELLHSGARYQEASLAIWYVGAGVALVVGFARISSFRSSQR